MRVWFQFPLHRDPRCNRPLWRLTISNWCFSSLYIGILAATLNDSSYILIRRRFSSLYIGILAATQLFHKLAPLFLSFSSLYIGILAATIPKGQIIQLLQCFSSLYIGILAATDLFLRFHTSLYWYFTMNTKRKPVGIFE